MISILPHILIPMILANVLHIVIIKKNALPQLTIPVWKSQFGANKTWRGFIVLPVLNGLFFAMTNAFLPVFGGMQAIEIGAILGFTYMLFELPNSWIKRKMGIASGQKAKHHAWLFMLMDKMDSSFGVSLVCYFFIGLANT